MARVALILVSHALACSYVEIPVPDESAVDGVKYVIGRTMELGDEHPAGDYQIRVHPRGEDNGIYGFVALENDFMFLNTTEPYFGYVGDGMNEVGLTVSAHTLRSSEYAALVKERDEDVPSGLVTRSLLRFAGTVGEAVTWLENHRIVGPSGKQGLHWAITDPSGRSIVIQYLHAGKLVVWENTPRVMTNDPALDWHWRNLNTYTNIQFDFPHQNDFLSVNTSIGPTPQALGHGWNLAGLPGDTSSPDRFIQLFYLRGYSMHSAPPKNSDDGIVLATGLLNKVFIPLGTVGPDGGDPDKFEYTPYGIVKIPHERRLLVRSYRDLRWRQVNLTKVDFTQTASWLVEDGSLGIKDLTDEDDGGKEDCLTII